MSKDLEAFKSLFLQSNPLKDLYSTLLAGSFPYYVGRSFGKEIVESKLDKKEEADIFSFNLLTEHDQTFDQYHAYKYAEEHLQHKSLSAMTAVELEIFIKMINGIAARALILINGKGQKPGEYNSAPIATTPETGRADCNFEHTPVYSAINKKTLKKLHGEKVAQDYKTFCDAIATAYPDWAKKQVVSASNVQKALMDVEDVPRFLAETGLDKHAAYYAYQKAFRIFNPKETPLKMKNFCEHLATMLMRKEDFYVCAAFILKELVGKIHPFFAGNKRTARIIVNCLFLSLNLPCVVVPQDKIGKFNLLVQDIDANDLKPLAKFLKECAQEKQEPANVPLVSWTDSPLICRDKQRGIALALTDQRYEVMSPKNADAYEGLQNSIEMAETLMSAAATPEVKAQHVREKAQLEQQKTLLVKFVIDGMTCLKKGRALEAKHPTLAGYVYYRSARFFAAQKNPAMTKAARDLAVKFLPQSAVILDAKQEVQSVPGKDKSAVQGQAQDPKIKLDVKDPGSTAVDLMKMFQLLGNMQTIEMSLADTQRLSGFPSLWAKANEPSDDKDQQNNNTPVKKLSFNSTSTS